MDEYPIPFGNRGHAGMGAGIPLPVMEHVHDGDRPTMATLWNLSAQEYARVKRKAQTIAVQGRQDLQIEGNVSRYRSIGLHRDSLNSQKASASKL